MNELQILMAVIVMLLLTNLAVRLALAARRDRIHAERVRVRVNKLLNDYGNDNWSARR